MQRSRRLSATVAAFCVAAAVSALLMPRDKAEAQGAQPVQAAITGDEELGDLTEPRQALAQFYRAFNSRDIRMIDDNFARSDDVAIDNPLGGIRRGANEPHRMYEAVFKSAADVHVVFWDYTIHRAGGVFWAVGRERGTYVDGGVAKDLNVRTTRIFQLIDGRWRQVHHHGSIEDAKLLAEYQNAVRSSASKAK